MEMGDGSIDELATLLTNSVRIMNRYATYFDSSFRSIKVKFEASPRDASDLRKFLDGIKSRTSDFMLEPRVYKNGRPSCHVLEVAYSEAAHHGEIAPNNEHFSIAIRRIADAVEEYALLRFLPDRSCHVDKSENR